MIIAYDLIYKRLKNQVKTPIMNKKASEMHVHLSSRVSSKIIKKEETYLLLITAFLEATNIDGFVKSRKSLEYVIPAKAGIQ